LIEWTGFVVDKSKRNANAKRELEQHVECKRARSERRWRSGEKGAREQQRGEGWGRKNGGAAATAARA